VTDRPTWILLPGFSQTPSAWSAIAGRLGRVRLPTIPDRGDFATTAALLAEENGPGIWAGYSMGGRLALQIAVDRPELVQHLVLISATAGIRDPQERSARRRADEKLAASIERDGIDHFLEHWARNPLFAGIEPSRLKEHRMQSSTAVADQLRRLGQGRQVPLWDRLNRVEVPTTVVAGATDARYAIIAADLAAAIPDAHLAILPGAGHALLIERPGEIAELLRRAG
jgi:2-succinyl-6-hydroxy-2,4-cyclohexadiene-1-carboxylate synthase